MNQSDRISFFKILLITACLQAGSGFAIETSERVDVDLKFPTVSNDDMPMTFEGRLKLQSARSDKVCFYSRVRDRDSKRYNVFARRFQSFLGVSESHLEIAGEFQIEQSRGIKWISDTVFSMDGAVTKGFSFKGRLPHLPDASKDDLFVEQAYPVLLSECPTEISDWIHLVFNPNVKHSINLQIPSGFHYSGLGKQENVKVSAEFRGVAHSFNLSKSNKRKTIQVDALPVHLDYEHDDFLKLDPTISKAVTALTKWLGPFPFASLTIVETSELQKFGLPGVISVNWPKQEAFRSLQSQWLNWREWVVVSQIAAQWIAATMTLESPDDFWLTLGVVDFLTLEVLRDDPNQFNLFKTSDSSFNLFSLNYLQFQDITAAYFYQKEPDVVLTDDSFESDSEFNQQHDLTFIKHALAMRYLKSILGDAGMQRFLKSFVSEFQYRIVTPKGFAFALSGQNLNALKALQEWWIRPGFPDLKLSNYSVTKVDGGKSLVHVDIELRGEQDLPAAVGLFDEDGRIALVQMKKDKNNRDFYTAEALIDKDLDEIEIDPKRDMFDGNRFDNSSRWSKIKFFPGNARGLLDDGYTILWVPYAFRRPGESYTLGIQSAIFRYIQNNWFLKFEGMPAEKKAAYQVRFEDKILNRAFTAQAQANQFYDDKIIFLAGLRRDFSLFAMNHGAGVQMRFRDFKNDHSKKHLSHAFQYNVGPRSRDIVCSPKLSAEFENAPPSWAKDFSYQRSLGRIGTSCELGWFGEFSAGFFAGNIKIDGEVPETLGFRVNDTSEAGIRMDLSPPKDPRKIYTVNLDQRIPFGIPFPGNSFVLSRQVRWQLFYDFGRSLDREETYQSTGGGIFLPMGGDLMGSGSLALTKLSFLWIFYQRSGEESTRKPSLLFNIAGNQ